MPEAATPACGCARPRPRFYGETQALHGIDLEVRRGRGRVPARPQRRRQDHHAARHRWACSTQRGGDIAIDGRSDRRACRRRPSPTSASPIARRSAASSPACDVEENLMLPPVLLPGGMTRRRDLRAVPQPAGAPPQPGHASCPAASSRCWRSPASCAPAPSCCCSTSRPRAWRR